MADAGINRSYDLEVAAEEYGEDILTEDEYELVMEQNAGSDLDPDDHYVNLANFLKESELQRIAQDVIEWVDADEESRDDWQDREVSGIRALGVSEETEGGADFEGASHVVHPLLAEACVQFQARAMSELWPPEGPVKTQVLGEQTVERGQQAERVKGFMNYQYTKLIPGAYDDHDMMMFRLPLSGSCFKKVYFCSLEGMPMPRYVEPSRFHVPYSASDLRTAERYTHEYYESWHYTKIKQRSGYYLDIDLVDPFHRGADLNEAEEEIDRTEGREPTDFDEDQTFTRYECHCYLNLPGFESEDGIGLPYVVTVDKDNSRTLAIYRNWKPTDPAQKKRVHFVHYKFLPGLGFYGYGFFHVIGGLARSATGALRAFLDASLLANMGGGFRSRDARTTGGTQEVKIGQWNEVEASAEELKNAFFPFPFKPPDDSLFKILGYLSDLGQRFASTTENMVSDANNNAPVGTTLALIEQGLKVFTGIHTRIHNAQAEEFQLMAELNAEYLPPMYPYDVAGEARGVFRADFDDRVDVIPVSDPNIISVTQRIALAQSILQLISSAPDLYGPAGMRVAHRNMLEALRAPNIDELLPEEEARPPRMDPVNENANILTGRPVVAYPEQDHISHNIVHNALLDQITDETGKAAMQAHMAEHTAHIYRLQIEQQIGVPIPPEEYPPEIEARIAQLVASQTIPSLPQAAPQQAEGDNKMAETVAKIQRDDLESAAGIRRDNVKALADIEREAARDMVQAGQEVAEAEEAIEQ